jgi:hypothetical protein
VKTLTDKVQKKVPKTRKKDIKKSSGRSTLNKNEKNKKKINTPGTVKKISVKNKSSDKSSTQKTVSVKNSPIAKQSRNINNLPEKIEDQIVDPSALLRGDDPMTIVEHLTEFRSRLMIIVASFFILVCIAFYFSDFLVYLINKPFLKTGFQLNIFTLAGGFMVKMKVSAAISILILVPLIIFHIWRFISPAIEKPERFFSRITIITAVLLF